MASITLHPDPQRFPVGTVLRVFPKPKSPWSEEGQPPGSQVAEATVEAVSPNSAVTFTGLAEGASYVAWATPNSYLGFKLESAAANVTKGEVETLIAEKAVSSVSPVFTGTPVAPTAAPGTNTTQLATTAFVAAVGALALQKASNLSDVASTVTARANLGLGTAATFPSSAFDAAGAAAAEEARAEAAEALKAPLGSPVFTGTPVAPTAAVGTSTTQVATTAFVTPGLTKLYNGQSTGAGEGTLEAFAALAAIDRTVHTSNTAFGWNALKALTGLTGVFALTAESAIAATVLNLTGVEAKAGPIWAGGTSNTPMIVFRKLTAGQTGIKVGVAYFVVSGTADAFSVSLTKGGAAIAVAGAALNVDTEVALLASAEDNTAIGSQAGKSLTTGGGNTLVGENSGVNLTTGEENSALGCEALANQTTQGSSVAVGFRALSQNTTGGGNTALGTSAMEANSTTGESTAVGFKAMQTAKSAKSVAVGYEALKLATGKGNTGVGIGAGKALTTGEENVLLGIFTGNALKTGSSNVAVGGEAFLTATEGSLNTAVGAQSLEKSTTASENTAVGAFALQKTTTGSPNTAVGVEALREATEGKNNTAVGAKALQKLTTTTGNVAIGKSAMQEAKEPKESVAIGVEALKVATTGAGNVAVGYQAGLLVSSGTHHTLLGYQAGSAITTAGNNTLVGYKAGALLTGKANVFLGFEAGAEETALENALIIANTKKANEAWIRGSESGKKLAVFGQEPISRTAAYTQTFATAARTHAEPELSTTIAATLVTELDTQLNSTNKAVNELKKLINSVIDDHQAYGWFQ